MSKADGSDRLPPRVVDAEPLKKPLTAIVEALIGAIDRAHTFALDAPSMSAIEFARRRSQLLEELEAALLTAKTIAGRLNAAYQK